MTRKYFGTDGIRGHVGEFPITPDFVLKLGWAVGRVFARKQKGLNLVLIGKDTRISGYMFESALQAGLINAGVDVGLLGPMPTPAIAYLTQTFRAQAGIVISASHNPYTDNGIKLFGYDGCKLPDDIEEEIERELDNEMVSVSAEDLGKARRIGDAGGRYVEFCKATLPRGLKLNDLHVVLDCAHGATYQVAPLVFRELGAKVDLIGTSPDGLNVNDGYGSTSPENLQKQVVDLGADMGIAFDGDGDRVMFVDRNGELVDGDELVFLIAAGKQQLSGCDGVVGTLMSNYGMEMAFRQRGIPFLRAGVGDRYVLQKMKEKGWQLGGESSGHIICKNVTTTGDGIVSALQVINALHILAQPLEEAKKGMSKLPQTMINIRVANKAALAGSQAVNDAVTETEEILADSGRVLLRPSGTEPVVRVMVEGKDEVQVEGLCQLLAEKVRSALA